MGGLVSYTASEGMNKTRNDKYYRGYYWWPAHTRLGTFVCGHVAYQLAPGLTGSRTLFRCSTSWAPTICTSSASAQTMARCPEQHPDLGTSRKV